MRLTVLIVRCFHAEMEIPNIRMISRVEIRNFRNHWSRILCERMKYETIDTSDNNLQMSGSLT